MQFAILEVNQITVDLVEMTTFNAEGTKSLTTSLNLVDLAGFAL